MKLTCLSIGSVTLPMFLAAAAQGQMAISGYMVNPPGTDSPYEYVQLVALQSIDFSAHNMSVVVCNNGTATTAGWAAGGTVSYKFNLTSGSVTAGEIFYVGGSGKLINGAGSTDISSANWLYTINTATTGGDGFGSAASNVFGNGGSSPDGIALFNTTTVTSSTVPVDAVFYGSGTGSVVNGGVDGYQLPVNDLYNGGKLQTTSTLLPDPAGGDFTKLSGTYDTSSGTWTMARTGTIINSPAQLSDIASQITTVPEPASLAVVGLGSLLALGTLRRHRRA
ncbi:MAG TPA: PEP-CTERM sorting domain-containing protein [Dongiaceae bacterium]|nr:PEP-CTERM sorting domain-containing protein [Dongiaceae bacterium]